MNAIPLTQLVTLSDEDIMKLNSAEGAQYIKFKNILLQDNASNSSNSQTSASVATKPVKPKRKCTEKQLAALAAGRAKNPRLLKKLQREKEAQEAQNEAQNAQNEAQNASNSAEK